jgi:hypothetical protein
VRTRHPASGDLGRPAATEERRIAKPFNGVINLHVRDAVAGWGPHGTARLYVDDRIVAESTLRTQPAHVAPCGEDLSIGRDSRAPVSVDAESDLPRRWRATEEREM